MKYRGGFLILCGAVCILCVSVQSSFALVYSGGLGHASAPDADPGWGNVGVMSIGSGAYLGDGWILAPYHVYQYNPAGGRYVDLDRRYYEIPGTAQRIEYSSSFDTDLIMFRIDGDPDLPVVEISSYSPLDDEVIVIAAGRSRVGDLVDFGGGYEGFTTSSLRVKRWGRNVTGGEAASKSSAFGRTMTFTTLFNAPGLGDDECQLVANDSGGSLFVEPLPGAPWQLAGMALSVDVPVDYSGPLITQYAVYGNYTVYADLASYRSQIDAIRQIPLPGDADRDGDVDGGDIGIFQTTFGQSGQGLQADFNYDNTVDLDDFAVIRFHFGMVSGHGISGDEGSSVQIIPEPATIVLLAGAIPMLWRSRRRG